MRSDVFSVGQIAKVLHVARSTVVRWIQNGHLKSTKTRGGDNRIARQDLAKFFEKKGIPIELMDDALGKKVLVYDKDEDLSSILKSSFKPEDGIIVKSALNPFDAGYLVNEFKPHVIIMDIDLRNSRQVNIIEFTKDSPELEDVKFIGTSFVNPESDDEWADLGFDAFLMKPVKQVELITVIKELLPTFRKYTTQDIK